jgi:hypothetical protein
MTILPAPWSVPGKQASAAARTTGSVGIVVLEAPFSTKVPSRELDFGQIRQHFIRHCGGDGIHLYPTEELHLR